MDEPHESDGGRVAPDPAVESLARSLDVEAEEVRLLYESILTEMKREAIIMDFLPIFAARKVKDMLLLKRTSP